MEKTENRRLLGNITLATAEMIRLLNILLDLLSNFIVQFQPKTFRKCHNILYTKNIKLSCTHTHTSFGCRLPIVATRRRRR